MSKHYLMKVVMLFFISKSILANSYPQEKNILLEKLPSSLGNIVKTETIKIDLIPSKLIEEDYRKLIERKENSLRKSIENFRYLDGKNQISIFEKLLILLDHPMEKNISKVIRNKSKLALLYKVYVLYYLYFLKKNKRIRTNILIEMKSLGNKLNVIYKIKDIPKVKNKIKIISVTSFLKFAFGKKYYQVTSGLSREWFKAFQEKVKFNIEKNKKKLLKKSIPYIIDSLRRVKQKKFNRYALIFILQIFDKMNWLSSYDKIIKIQQFYKTHKLTTQYKFAN